MKIDEIMFSDKELAIASAGKKNDVLKPSAKEVGRNANLSQDEKEKRRAEREEKKNDPDRVVYPRYPHHLPHEKAKREYAKMKKAAEKAHAEKKAKKEKRDLEKSEKAALAPITKAKQRQDKIDTDLKKINAVKKSQPLPAEPEDEKRRVATAHEKGYMDRYWGRYKDG